MDTQILDMPYLRDDMDVYSFDGKVWRVWTPEDQRYRQLMGGDIPEMVQLTMVMFE